MADDEPTAGEAHESEGAAENAEDSGASTVDESTPMPSIADLMDALNQIKVGELLLSTVSTLASIAYGRIEKRDLGEAKMAIDAIRALMPILEGGVDAGMRRDFEQALTNLQLAYADAVSRAE